MIIVCGWLGFHGTDKTPILGRIGANTKFRAEGSPSVCSLLSISLPCLSTSPSYPSHCTPSSIPDLSSSSITSPSFHFHFLSKHFPPSRHRFLASSPPPRLLASRFSPSLNLPSYSLLLPSLLPSPLTSLSLPNRSLTYFSVSSCPLFPPLLFSLSPPLPSLSPPALPHSLIPFPGTPNPSFSQPSLSRSPLGLHV